MVLSGVLLVLSYDSPVSDERVSGLSNAITDTPGIGEGHQLLLTLHVKACDTKNNLIAWSRDSRLLHM